MSDLIGLAREYPWLAWSALWLLWAAVPLAEVGFRIINRLFRLILVSINGWPPPHLDADGDWKPRAPDSP